MKLSVDPAEAMLDELRDEYTRVHRLWTDSEIKTARLKREVDALGKAIDGLNESVKIAKEGRR